MLGISLPLDKKTERVLSDQDSYEAKVKERILMPDDSQKHDFGSRYRDLRSASPSALDELETESDLETHAGDDDFNHSTHLEEEDEGYGSLHSQFKNVRIRKRQRDDVEDTEDHGGAWQGDGLAHLDGDGKQKAVKMRLTDEERTHQGKKSRTDDATL